MPNQRDEESTPMGARAAGQRDDAGAETAGDAATEPAERVLTLVCLTCGQEYHFSDEAPPEGMSCERCGNTVFRDFFSDEGDEAANDFRDSTARDLDTDDAEGDTLPGDILDLNRD